MHRDSNAPDFDVKDSYVYELAIEKDLRWVRRVNGTEAVGALSREGLSLLTSMAGKFPFEGWMQYKLPGKSGWVYLIEQPKGR